MADGGCGSLLFKLLILFSFTPSPPRTIVRRIKSNQMKRRFVPNRRGFGHILPRVEDEDSLQRDAVPNDMPIVEGGILPLRRTSGGHDEEYEKYSWRQRNFVLGRNRRK